MGILIGIVKAFCHTWKKLKANIRYSSLIEAKIKHIHLNKGLLFQTEFQDET